MAKRWTKETLAEALGMSEGLLRMEIDKLKSVKEYDNVGGTVKRVFTEADRLQIMSNRKKRGLDTPPTK